MTFQKTSLRKIDEPWFSQFQALFLAFYSKKLYLDVFHRWKGMGLRYLLLLCFVFSLPFVVRVGFEFDHFFTKWVLSPLQEFPQIMVQNGELNFNKPMPYIIKNKDGVVVAIIDARGEMEQYTQQYPYLLYLFTEHKFYSRTATPVFYNPSAPPTINPKIHEQLYEKKDNEIFDPNVFIKTYQLESFKYFFPLFLYALVSLVAFGLFSSLALIFSMMAQLMAYIVFQFKMTYFQATRLFIVAATPALFLFFLALVSGALVAGLPYLLMGLICFYFSYGLVMIRKEGARLTRL